MKQADIFTALQEGLKQAGSVQTPEETHGTLTGMLCVDNTQAPSAAVDDVTTETLSTALEALRDMTLNGLFDTELSFTPLLPSDEQPLEERVNALAGWCAGFLFGLSYQGRFNPAELSSEIQEVVNDLTEMSKVELADEDIERQESEADYTELVEYVRVSAQMIFLELQPKKQGPEYRDKLH